MGKQLACCGQRPEGMEDNCIERQGPYRTAVFQEDDGDNNDEHNVNIFNMKL